MQGEVGPRCSVGEPAFVREASPEHTVSMYDLAALAASSLDVAVLIVPIVALVGTVVILVRAILRSRAPHNLERYKQGWVDARKRMPPLAHDRHYLKGYKAAYSAEIAEQNRRMQ